MQRPGTTSTPFPQVAHEPLLPRRLGVLLLPPFPAGYRGGGGGVLLLLLLLLL